MNDKSAVFLLIFTALCVGFLIAAILACYDQRNFKAEAVAHGVAEWVIDPETGNRSWNWKQPTAPPAKEPMIVVDPITGELKLNPSYQVTPKENK